MNLYNMNMLQNERTLTMKNCKVGLLPLYLELYDDACPEMRPRIEEFYNKVSDSLTTYGISIVKVPLCRVKEEFHAAVDIFEKEDVCAVITLHMAYSPSLESIDAICRLNVPIIILDTTETECFDNTTDPDEIMYNHGIHGVQDMCNMLLRKGKKFFIEAGHFTQSDVIKRVAGLCRAAIGAMNLHNAKVGIIGQPFHGMGDFNVPFDVLQSTIGIKIITFSEDDAQRYKSEIKNTDLSAEIEADLKRFDIVGYNKSAHERSARAGLLLRTWIDENELTAFSVNFMKIDKNSDFECMPFLEISKQMTDGVGYAGEGDVLTAALVGALASVYPDTTFTEMFCPDWQGNSIFLSHMGEINLNLTAEKPRLVEKDFPFTSAKNPLVAYGRYKQGTAVLVNIAPIGDDKYKLILSQVEVLDIDGQDKMQDSIHGWVQPQKPISDFLKEYSMAGGTHHLAMVYGDVINELNSMGKMLGLPVLMI